MGILIVLDGLDGSGKSTQAALLRERLEKTYGKTRLISYPDYEKPSSVLVRMYLNGELSDRASDVNAYAASSFYAVDRYASYRQDWKQAYEEGEIILASRYVSSNAIHQMASFRAISGRRFCGGCPIMNMKNWVCRVRMQSFSWICPELLRIG